MSSTRLPARNTGFSALRRLAREGAAADAEHCELCSKPLAASHGHLLDVSTRKVTCACEPCSILFATPGASTYRRVPRRIRRVPGFRLDDATWDAMRIPINLAFFFHASTTGRVVALYPSPAGATESLLDLAAWEGLVAENPVLATLEPDVEALLVDRVAGASPEYYLAPIDECFKLVGLIRARWRGLSGGAEVWSEIRGFFDDLRRRATDVEERPRA